MTLSNQNKLLLSFSTLSSIIGLSLIIGLVLYFINSYSIEQTPIFPMENFSLKTLFTEEHTLYTILSYVTFLFYVPIVGFTIYSTFEKTKSPEMLYYFGMLIGFFAESLLLCIPIFSLETGYTIFLRSISSIAFFGQMQVILSIMFQGALVAQEELRDSDKFLGIFSIIAMGFSVIIPINTTQVAVNYSPEYGLESVFSVIRIIFVLITFGAMFLSPTSAKFPDYRKASIAFLIMCIGYIFLLYTTTLISLTFGVIFLISGTVFFLTKLHSYYMWK